MRDDIPTLDLGARRGGPERDRETCSYARSTNGRVIARCARSRLPTVDPARDIQQ
jgi:hypothetical protein